MNKRHSQWYRTIIWLVAAILVSLPLTARTAHADDGWWGEYYANTSLSGSPVLTRTDPMIGFEWGDGAPGANVPADSFSARWTRTVWFNSGTYRFHAFSDDGFRLWVGDLLVIDAWVDQQGGGLSRDLYLGQGNYRLKVEYYEHQGNATVRLGWEWLTPGQAWFTEYFGNQSLAGSPVVRRTDAAVNFNWGAGSPDPAVPIDHFSARWSFSVGLAAGTYRFQTRTDDGVRLWVNDRLVIDAWYDQTVDATRSGDIALPQGVYQIKVEYYENTGQAEAHAWWDRISTPAPLPNAWRAEYYDNRNLSGNPVLVRDDADVSFDWGLGAPVSWMPSDNFGARWSRQITFSAGYYRLSVRSDDGVRVWLDNGLIIDKWYPMAYEHHYVDGIYLTGSHRVMVEYFEQTLQARIQFWISPSSDSSNPPTPTPAPAPTPTPPSSATPGTVVVDNTSPGFVKGGSATAWRTAALGYGNSLLWTRNNDYARANYNWARWNASLTPGRYEVYVYVPANYASTTGARYWVKHAGGYALRQVNQSIYYGEWVSLGSYDFSGSNEYVSLSDITYERYLSRMVGFDAVMWVPR